LCVAVAEGSVAGEGPWVARGQRCDDARRLAVECGTVESHWRARECGGNPARLPQSHGGVPRRKWRGVLRRNIARDRSGESNVRDGLRLGRGRRREARGLPFALPFAIFDAARERVQDGRLDSGLYASAVDGDGSWVD